MVIIETPTFTRQMINLMSDDEYRSLQLLLVEKPETGKLIPASGGLRKLILMLAAYTKSERTDLTNQQLLILRRVVEEEFK